MLKKILLALIISLCMELVTYAENWVPVGKPGSRPEELINEFYKHLIAGSKTDVAEALRNTSYRIYIDVDSITDIREGVRESSLKTVFDNEQAMEGTDKKFKYIIARINFHRAQEVLWFVDGEVYNESGEALRDSETVYIPLDLKELPNTAPERDNWKFVCNYKKDSK
jgi:hypothetical protein